jgi:hypothetical protein
VPEDERTKKKRIFMKKNQIKPKKKIYLKRRKKRFTRLRP